MNEAKRVALEKTTPLRDLAASRQVDLGDDRLLVERLRAPAYWMSGSSDGHEGENDLPRVAADRIATLRGALEEVRVEAAKGAIAGPVRLAKIHGIARAALSSVTK